MIKWEEIPKYYAWADAIMGQMDTRHGSIERESVLCGTPVLNYNNLNWKYKIGEDFINASFLPNSNDPVELAKTIDKLVQDEEFRKKLDELGETPLPKYIKRGVEPSDEERYQTIYAKHEGAVAAPTAGLHFSKHLMKRMEIKGVDFSEITLHVGLGTFSPVEVEDLSKHKMDSEQVLISKDTIQMVNNTLDKKQRVCAVGTTVMRAMESSVSSNSRLNQFDGWTNKFIFPPYDFSIANCMVTNFHTPKSTLMMMVAAFAGYDFLMEAYKEAVKEKYQFYSYGDAMLII